MPPTPTEDIDFPALIDKIIELLRASWTFVSNLCISLWFHISQAFWAVWTYPPFETFRDGLVVVLIFLVVFVYYVIVHLITALAIIILVCIVILLVLNVLIVFLRCAGFGRQGVLHGSYAANYQSTVYGGNVPSGSIFAQFQSQGARAPSGAW